MTTTINLAALAEQSLERFGDRDSLWFEGSWFRTGTLHERACRLAGGLRQLGVCPGDRVAVLMPNSPDVTVAYAAIWRAGAVVTPLIFLLSEQELAFVLRDSEACALITAPELLAKARAAAQAAPGLRAIILAGAAGEQAGGPVLEWSQLEQAAPAAIEPRSPQDLAALLYTGGTTGRAKGVMLSHENLWFAGKSAHDLSHTPGVTRTLVPLPLSHGFGLLVTVVGLHAAEPGVAVIQRWFDPLSFLELAQEHKVQQAPVVPSMLQLLLAMPLESYELSSLVSFTCGGSSLPPQVALEIERRLPGVEVREGYGCTESGAVISASPPGRRRLGSAGLALPGYEVRVLDPEGRSLPVGQVGEVCCRSRGVMRGYWKSPDLTQDILIDGWLHTGDIGRLDEDGYLWIVDRQKDLIIRNGFNVFPRDVEDALLEHPEVAAAGVVGRPDQVRGEEVVAFVSLKPGASASPAALVQFARSRLAANKYPRQVQILDLLPMTAVGKVDRKALRRLAAELPAEPGSQSPTGE